MTYVSAGAELELRRISGRIGAEIIGLKVGGDLDEATVQAIKAALAEHKVLFFRGQTHLDDAGQEAFAALLGTPERHPTIPARANFLMELDSLHLGRVNSWHTDSTFLVGYPYATILRSVQLPSVGGDTMWCNTAAAYRGLPKVLAKLVDDLWCIHTNVIDYGAHWNDKTEDEVDAIMAMAASTVFEAEHPVVRIHPETGERALVLGHFFKQFVGMSVSNSDKLYALLQEHVTRPENCLRWTWALGDVAIWDNRSTQHYAVFDYEERRVMRRCTLAGDVPVSIDGKSSRQKKPKADLPQAVAG